MEPVQDIPCLWAQEADTRYRAVPINHESWRRDRPSCYTSRSPGLYTSRGGQLLRRFRLLLFLQTAKMAPRATAKKTKANEETPSSETLGLARPSAPTPPAFHSTSSILGGGSRSSGTHSPPSSSPRGAATASTAGMSPPSGWLSYITWHSFKYDISGNSSLPGEKKIQRREGRQRGAGGGGAAFLARFRGYSAGILVEKEGPPWGSGSRAIGTCMLLHNKPGARPPRANNVQGFFVFWSTDVTKTTQEFSNAGLFCHGSLRQRTKPRVKQLLRCLSCMPRTSGTRFRDS